MLFSRKSNELGEPSPIYAHAESRKKSPPPCSFIICGACFGIDLGLYGSGPWNFELLHADTSEALRSAVTARQAERTATELWMTCAHYMDDEMSYAVFHADNSGVLELTFSMSFLTPKPREGGFYRALLFWRDENTGKALPWHNG